MKSCTDTPGSASDKACSNGDSTCRQATEWQLEGSWDVYDIRADSDSYPPSTYVNYLNSAAVKKAIGAQGDYSECGGSRIGSADSGRSFLRTLGKVVDSGVNTLIWAGDADWICNWIGNLEAANAIGGSTFAGKSVQPFTVNGKQYGEYKTNKNLNWLRVYEAGHEVPAYQPEAALAAFTAIINKKPLTSS